MFVLAVLLFAAAVVASDGSPSHDRGEIIEENAALKAKFASQKMALAQLVDSKRQNGQKMALARLVDAKKQNGAESRQADVEDAVREIVASEIESHDADLRDEVESIKTLLKSLICFTKKASDFTTSVVYDGTAGASSHYDSSYVAEYAFTGSNSERWASLTTLPAKLWFNFTSPVKVGAISFEPPFDSSYWKEAPKKFDLIASSDCTNWKVLRTVGNAGFTRQGQVKSWKIPCDQQKSYKCYGIEGREDSGYGGYLSLADMRMFRAPK